MEVVVTFQNTFVRWYQICKGEVIMLQGIFKSVCGVRRNHCGRNANFLLEQKCAVSFLFSDD